MNYPEILKYGIQLIHCYNCSEEFEYVITKCKKTHCISCGENLYDGGIIMIPLNCKICGKFVKDVDKDDIQKYDDICDTDECRERLCENLNSYWIAMYPKAQIFSRHMESPYVYIHKNLNDRKVRIESIEFQFTMLYDHDSRRREMLRKLFSSYEWNKDILDSK